MLYFRPRALPPLQLNRFKCPASDPKRSTCRRSCFSTSCEVKRTGCTGYFGIANSHGRVIVMENKQGAISKNRLL